MADFSQFIIPQQDFSGLYKIGQQLEGKQEAKVKAAQDAANKKATTSALLAKDLELSNFTTGTVEDQIFSRDLGKIQQKADLMAQGGYDYNHIRMGISDDVAKLRTATENIKYAETQRKLGLENIKGKKGYNPDAYNAEFIKKYYLGADGKPREDYWNLDTAVDFDSEVKKSGNIYNLDEAVGEDIKGMAKSSKEEEVNVRDAKGNVKKVKKKIQTSSSFVPDIDEKGVFQGVVPEHTVAPTTDATKSISEYISGDANKPLRLVSDNEFNRMRYNPAVMGGINAETQKFAQALGRVPQPEEIIAFQKAKLYDIYANNAKVGFAHEDVKVTQAPVTKNITNVSVGGAGGVVRDLFTPAMNIYNKLQARKDKVSELISKNYSNEQIKKETGLAVSAIESSRLGRNKAALPLNIKGLDAAFVNSIVETVNAGGTISEEDALSGAKSKKYDRTNLFVQLNDDASAWEVYSAEKDKPSELITTVDAATLGYGVQPNYKGKVGLVIQEKKGKQSKSAISAYPSDIQYATKAGISEDVAISRLIKANKIKPQ